VNAQTPGAIHEGGELGYVLSVAYGSVMNHPDLISIAVVGDGEAETGPTAAYVPEMRELSILTLLQTELGMQTSTSIPKSPARSCRYCTSTDLK
jgi:transketolase N-terminal domain/subunit